MVIAVLDGSRQVKKICRPSRDHSAKEHVKFGGLRRTRRLDSISKRKNACPGCVAASLFGAAPLFEAAAAGCGSNSAETSSKSGLSGWMRTVLALDKLNWFLPYKSALETVCFTLPSSAT